MNIIQLNTDIFDHETSELFTRYLSDPSDLNFNNLARNKKLIDTGKFTDIIYDICLQPPWKALAIDHLIKCLFFNGRFIETLYYCDYYKSKFRINKEIVRVYTMARIEAGLLLPEDELLKECVAIGEDKHQELILRIAYCLRAGHLQRAHDLSIKLLLYFPDCSEHGYVVIVETAIRAKDNDLLFTALNEAKKKKVEPEFGRRRRNQISHLLRLSVVRILAAVLTDKENKE